MIKNIRPRYSADFKLELAQLVVDLGYSILETVAAMNESKSAIEACCMVVSY